MKILFPLIFIALCWSVSAQVTDDFSDGDLTNNPSWTGQADDFMVNDNLELQLYNSSGGQSMLSTVSALSDSVEWFFRIRLAFSPSSNNFARIFLMSDTADLLALNDGYFLQFGESGAGDAIELFRKTGQVVQSICRGTEGAIASSFDLNIKVTYSNEGEWSLWTAPVGSTSYTKETGGVDPVLQPGGYFGLHCAYTHSNSTKFYFDDFLIREILPDTVPPFVLQVTVVAQDQLDVRFSEGVDPESAGYAGNYTVITAETNPLQASPDMTDASLVHLQFGFSFETGQPDHLSISNIFDQAGNTITPVSFPFVYYLAGPYDILINEIMADPEPAVSLPAMEYVELYNHSVFPVSLNQWILETGSSVRTFPDITLLPDSYLLITKGNELSFFGTCVPLFTSTYTLGNEGSVIRLKDPAGHLIHAVAYAQDWCTDEWKFTGGWSLELIDPENPCGEDGNWTASIDPSGGTPGRINSVRSYNPDTTPPRIHHAGIISGNLVRIWFSEKMDSVSLLDPGRFRISPETGPLHVFTAGDDYQSVCLNPENPLTDTTLYLLHLRMPLYDCSGNETGQDASVKLGIPYQTGFIDLVINEILFDPLEGGVDFVEIYNRSARFYDLSDLVMATIDTFSLQVTDTESVTGDSFLIAPGDYKVMTTDPWAVMSHYNCPDPDAFIRMTALPPMGNEAGNIVLALKNDGTVIDRVDYTSSLHFSLIRDTDGVSLERVHYDRPSGDPGNWHSAAETVGFATPGYQNSQYSMVPPEREDPFFIDPGTFSPDNDGIEDVLNIRYRFSTPGNMVSILIFDSMGRLVKTLINNTLAGTEGVFSWDGSLDRVSIGSDGIYIIFARVFTLSGNTEEYKNVCVLRSRRDQ